MKSKINKRDLIAYWFATQAHKLLKKQILSTRIGELTFYWYILPRNQGQVMILSQNDKEQKAGMSFQWGTHQIDSLADPLYELHDYLSTKIDKQSARKLIREIHRTSRRDAYIKRLYKIMAAKTLTWTEKSIKRTDLTKNQERQNNR